MEPPRDVGHIRLHRELSILDDKSKLDTKYSYDHMPAQFTIIINKILKINYGKHFPFEPPKITFLLNESQNQYSNCYCLFELEKLDLCDILKEEYHPTFTFAKMSERCFKFLDQNTISKEMRYQLSWS